MEPLISMQIFGLAVIKNDQWMSSHPLVRGSCTRTYAHATNKHILLFAPKQHLCHLKEQAPTEWKRFLLFMCEMNSSWTWTTRRAGKILCAHMVAPSPTQMDNTRVEVDSVWSRHSAFIHTHFRGLGKIWLTAGGEISPFINLQSFSSRISDAHEGG